MKHKKSPWKPKRQTSALTPTIWVKNPIHPNSDSDPEHAAQGSTEQAHTLTIMSVKEGTSGQTWEHISGLHTEQQHTCPAITNSALIYSSGALGKT